MLVDSVVMAGRMATARCLLECGATLEEARGVVGETVAAVLGSSPPASVQAAVMARSGGLCELCGLGPRIAPASGKLVAFTVERIAPSTPLADYDDPSNLLWVCGPCVASEMVWRPPAVDLLGDAFVVPVVGYGWRCRRCDRNSTTAFKTEQTAKDALALHTARNHS